MRDRVKGDLEKALGTGYTVERFTMFDQPRTKYFSRVWSQQQLTEEQKDGIGVAYLAHILGVEQQVIEIFTRREFDPSSHLDQFLRGSKESQWSDYNADRAVGERQASLDRCRKDYAEFWQAVRSVAPGMCDDDEIHWLIQANVWVVAQLLCHLDRTSLVLARIERNAYRYK